MEAILKFKLPNDQSKFDICNAASQMNSALWDIEQFLRSKVKYGELSEEEAKVYEEVRTKFYDILSGVPGYPF